MTVGRHWHRYWGVYLFLFVFLVGILSDRLPRHSPPCSSPIEFRLGAIDPRFGLGEAQAKDALAQAASLWNTAAKKTVLSSSPSAGMPVNFVYSQQQDTTKVHQAISSSIAENRQKALEISNQVERLKADLSIKRQRFEAAKAELNLATSAYNLRVQDFNGSGRGSGYARQQLEAQKAQILLRQQDLEQQVAPLKAIADRINRLTSEYNTQVMLEHTNIDAINVDAGREFLAGEYVNRNGTQEIMIFEYNNFGSLVAVLAHELGHALGLGHVNNSRSIMSASSEQRENYSPSIELSDSDLIALRERCGL